jgi:hypothetical protein
MCKNVKKFKNHNIAATCFFSRRNHHQGAGPFLSKITDMVFSVLVEMNSVNAVAAYWPVEQACVLALLHNRPI